jgi:hypothetical protein
MVPAIPKAAERGPTRELFPPLPSAEDRAEVFAPESALVGLEAARSLPGTIDAAWSR